jgi:hypothetical protein
VRQVQTANVVPLATAHAGAMEPTGSAGA